MGGHDGPQGTLAAVDIGNDHGASAAGGAPLVSVDVGGDNGPQGTLAAVELGGGGGVHGSAPLAVAAVGDAGGAHGTLVDAHVLDGPDAGAPEEDWGGGTGILSGTDGLSTAQVSAVADALADSWGGGGCDGAGGAPVTYPFGADAPEAGEGPLLEIDASPGLLADDGCGCDHHAMPLAEAA